MVDEPCLEPPPPNPTGVLLAITALAPQSGTYETGTMTGPSQSPYGPTGRPTMSKPLSVHMSRACSADKLPWVEPPAHINS